MAGRTEGPLEVAIIGAGVAGLALAVELQRNGVSFTVYERAATLGGERGHGMGLTVQGGQAMETLDPRLYRMRHIMAGDRQHVEFNYVGGVNERKGNPRDTAQEYKGYYDDYSDAQRSAFLAELERLVPKNRIKLGKTLVWIQKKSNPVVLTFEDGSIAMADVVVGCDGIQSCVRHIMFGPDPPTSYSHAITFRGLVPQKIARAALGDEKTSRATFYLESHSLLITYPERGGARVGDVNVVAFVHDPAEWPGTTTKSRGGEQAEVLGAQRFAQPITRSEAMRMFQKCGPTMRTFISLLPEKMEKWAIFDIVDRPMCSYLLGPVCLAGDAAQPPSPHHGASVGMGIEDALVLAKLLAKVNIRSRSLSSSTMVKEALYAYQADRYHRAMPLVNRSRYLGQLYHWRIPEECGNDKDKMEAKYLPRHRRIYYYQDDGFDFDNGWPWGFALRSLEKRLELHESSNCSLMGAVLLIVILVAWYCR